MSKHTVPSPVKAAYPGGVCPDCGEAIPDDAPEGWGCPNCGHACYSEEIGVEPEPPCDTWCWCSQDGWMRTDSVEFLNIEEGFDGRDTMTFECPNCRVERKSVVVRGNPG